MKKQNLYIKKNNLNFFLEKIPSYLIILLPVLLVSGSFLPDLAITVCCICFLLISFKKKNFFYFKNNFFIFFIIFYIYLLISSLLSSNILFSLHSSLFFFRVILFSLCVWYLLDINEYFILKRLFYVLVFVLIFLSIDGTYQLIYKKNIFGLKLINDRVSSFFGDELIMGSFVSRIFPIFVGLFYYLKNKKNNLIFSEYFYLIITILSGYLVLISGERASLFFYILSIFFLSLMNLFRIKYLIIIITTLTIFFSFHNTTFNRMFNNTLEQIVLENKRVTFFSSVHEAHYLSAYKIFKDNIILGAGPRNFRFFCNDNKYLISKYSCTTHPHNTYIQILAETGLIGFFFICFIFFHILRESIKVFFLKHKNKFRKFYISILAMILITLWPLVPSGNFFHNWLLVIYFLPAGFYLWLKDKLNKV
jgi:O-antigen ligase